MRKPAQNKGFTLIEILLVVVIIGLMLAVIVPRAWRANVDTKYNLVRQNCNELASFGMEWVEQQMQAQPEDYGTTLFDYLQTLSGTNAWVPSAAYNWRQPSLVSHTGPPAYSLTPQTAVVGIVPPDKRPRNPFNGVSYFESPNNPATAGIVAGAIACGRVTETSGWNYYAFMWQGADSTATPWFDPGTFHGGQKRFAVAGTRLEGLRNGVFFARARN